MECGFSANAQSANGAGILRDEGSDEDDIHGIAGLQTAVGKLDALILPVGRAVPGFVVNILVIVIDRTACQWQADQND